MEDLINKNNQGPNKSKYHVSKPLSQSLYLKNNLGANHTLREVC